MKTKYIYWVARSSALALVIRDRFLSVLQERANIVSENTEGATIKIKYSLKRGMKPFTVGELNRATEGKYE